MKNKKKVMYVFVGIALALVFAFIAIPNQASARENKVYLSDMQSKILSTESLDGKIGFDAAYVDDVTPLVIAGRTYNKGLNMHCLQQGNAYVEFDISGGNYKQFIAYVGVLDYYPGIVVGPSSINYIVKVDGNVVAESGEIGYGEEAKLITADITGASVLRLEMDNCGGFSFDMGVWGEAYLTDSTDPAPSVPPTPVITEKPVVTQRPELLEKDPLYISDMEWSAWEAYQDSSMTESVFRDSDVLYNEIVLDYEYYDKGIGMHAIATAGNKVAFLELNVENLGYTTFVSYVGVPQSPANLSFASIEFIVYVDGVEKYRSGIMGNESPASLCLVNIEGASTLRLEMTDGGDGITSDWGVWAGAALSKKSTVEDIFATPVPTATPIPTATPEATEAPKTTQAPTEEPSEKEGGCGSSSAIAQVLLILGVALIIKKKK